MPDESLQHLKGKSIFFSRLEVYLLEKKKERNNTSVISTHYELFSLARTTDTFPQLTPF